MGQYEEIKGKYPDAILLFRVGDFYETFGSDAVKTAQALDIVLTKRANGSASEVELAGFPHHALNTYLPKLVRAGFRVAICDQLEDPKKTKKLVKRGVTELLTPGLAVGEGLIENRKANFLASWIRTEKEEAVAFLELSTGEFFYARADQHEVERLLHRYQPSEVIVPRSQYRSRQEQLGTQFYWYALDDWIFEEAFGQQKLEAQFPKTALKSFGLTEAHSGVRCCGALLHYLHDNEQKALDHIQAIYELRQGASLAMDSFTLRNLELLESMTAQGASLLSCIDRTSTAMGARMLRKWIAAPLLDISEIEHRHDTVESLIGEPELNEYLLEPLQAIGDLQRSIARLAMGKGSPRLLGQIREACRQFQPLKEKLSSSSSDKLSRIGEQIHEKAALREKLDAELEEELPAFLHKAYIFKPGLDPELDEWKELLSNTQGHMASMKDEEAEISGISQLKIGFNNVFGYYFEVSRRFSDQVPEHWVRKQTLVNAERFITPKLKDFEEKLQDAEQRIRDLEQKHFDRLCSELLSELSDLQENALIISQLDVCRGFAIKAQEASYIRPAMDDSSHIDIVAGRHPVIEHFLPPGQGYIPNDMQLNRTEEQLLLITGPNMSGKSALLRQTALIVILAQAGSFVPAESAKIGLVDSLFTRVGASDNLAAGESTFMVEMIETASILHHMTPRSLILLDEIGRGTSTYDGISIAWSIVEYLQSCKERPRTLFATHYHELSHLGDELEGVKNCHISTREEGDRVIFLRKLEPGHSRRSFGIHVAQMAGLPKKLLQRATEVLEVMEDKAPQLGTAEQIPSYQANQQLQIFEMADPRLDQLQQELANTDINAMTPLEALNKLDQIKSLISKS